MGFLADWCGVKPAEGRALELLNEMSEAAFRLIKVIELEKSGIRDGNGFGYWAGVNEMNLTAQELQRVLEAWKVWDAEEYQRRAKRDAEIKASLAKRFAERDAKLKAQREAAQARRKAKKRKELIR